MGPNQALRACREVTPVRVAGWQGSWAKALGAARQPAAQCAWHPRSAARSHGKPERAENGHSTEDSSTHPILV